MVSLRKLYNTLKISHQYYPDHPKNDIKIYFTLQYPEETGIRIVMCCFQKPKHCFKKDIGMKFIVVQNISANYKLYERTSEHVYDKDIQHTNPCQSLSLSNILKEFLLLLRTTSFQMSLIFNKLGTMLKLLTNAITGTLCCLTEGKVSRGIFH